MNCRDWEERLALYQGGDLPSGEAIKVERHLGDCPGCQLFSSGLKEAQELLRELHREPLAPAHFAAVRARVLSELERERRPFAKSALVAQTIASCGLAAFRQRKWLLGFATVAAMLLVAPLVFRPVRSPSPGPPTALAPARSQTTAAAMSSVQSEAPAVLPAAQASSQGPTTTRRLVRKSPARSNSQPGEQVLIRVVSDNPDVVIYWIADTKGD